MITITINNGKKKWMLRQFKKGEWSDVAEVLCEDKDSSELTDFLVSRDQGGYKLESDKTPNTKMENMNYYPLRVGKYSSVIVSDTFPKERAIRYKKSEMDSEWEHYGGFIIAESVPPEMAQKLVDAYNEKYAPKDFLGHPSLDDQIGRKTNCTQPDCDCVEQAEKKAGGPVKRYECLARPGFEYIPYPDSGHSFTEGMEMDSISNDKSVFEPNKPTIDDQIAFMKNSRHSILGSDDAIYTAIIENLKAIKRWNESPAYHGKVDVEKVIEDLVGPLRDVIELRGYHHAVVSNAIQNAEAALGMLQVFKEEREAGMAPREAPEWIKKHAHVTTRPLTPKDVAEAYHAGVNILNRKAMYEYISQSERDELVKEVYHKMSGKVPGCIYIAHAIIFAIESIDHLKRKHGK